LSEVTKDCVICSKEATTAARGTIEKDYINFCSFHAGAMQIIFETLNVSDSIKWRPLVIKIIE